VRFAHRVTRVAGSATAAFIPLLRRMQTEGRDVINLAIGEPDYPLPPAVADAIDRALREGRLDEDGFVTESIESLGLAMRAELGRSLPEKLTERKRVLERLRKLRLIQYRHDEDLDSMETGLRIHPMIVSFVTEQALDALEEALPKAPLEDAADVS